jgi:cell filamentation protein
MTESTDPYLYPGTYALKNLRDIRDPGMLARFEAEATSRRIIELIDTPAQRRFDAAYLSAIHKHIFQDVYAWAGQFRTVNIAKDGHLFGAAAFLDPALDDVFRKLSAEQHLRGTDPGSFVKRAGFFLSEVNAAHPFREGNGRTQREFIRELGLQAGFAIDWSRIARDEMIAASRESFGTGNTSGLAELIRRSAAET